MAGADDGSMIDTTGYMTWLRKFLDNVEAGGEGEILHKVAGEDNLSIY